MLGDLLNAIDVDLGKGEEVRNGERLRELGIHGRNGLARPAPVGVEVSDDVLGRVEESRKLLGRVDVLDAVRHCDDACVRLRECRLVGRLYEIPRSMTVREIHSVMRRDYSHLN